MNTQDILKFYGSKLDIYLDQSEYFDYEIVKNDLDYSTDILDLSTPITYDTKIIDSSCLTGLTTPWEIPINENYTTDNCDFTVRRRTENGWTLNFVFNRENLPWSSGNTFYYLGLVDETIEDNYMDNNLSFSFTTDGRIMWKAIHYSGYCSTDSGYTGSSYTVSGQTGVLCTGGTSDDFNITITFERNKNLTLCNLVNDGGQNDLITGWTVTNVLDVMTGATEDYTIIEGLSYKWWDERYNRLGTLKIYLNGRPIYKLKDWEEIIPSQRNSENLLEQIWGGGTTGSGDIHEGDTFFNLKRVQYFEEPLDFLHVRHHYLTSIKPQYSITECVSDCTDSATSLTDGVLLTESGDFIVTENNDIIVF